METTFLWCFEAEKKLTHRGERPNDLSQNGQNTAKSQPSPRFLWTVSMIDIYVTHDKNAPRKTTFNN